MSNDFMTKISVRICGILGNLARQEEGFESPSQWWEVGKAYIRVFCQQYTSNSTVRVSRVITTLEEEIKNIWKPM